MAYVKLTLNDKEWARLESMAAAQYLKPTTLAKVWFIVGGGFVDKPLSKLADALKQMKKSKEKEGKTTGNPPEKNRKTPQNRRKK